MKKLLLILPLLFLFPLCSFGQQVTTQEASRAALNIARQETSGDTITNTLSTNICYDEHGNILMYEVVLSNGTSVLLSGNRNCKPLLGINYNSTTSIFDTLDDRPDGVNDIIHRYSRQIAKQYSSGNVCRENQDKWDSLLYCCQARSVQPRAAVIGPLTTTEWNQGDPYNRYVQEECTNGGKCKVGCTAVAMGQIMKFWNYPVLTPDISRQFDWCNMPDVPSTDEEKDAVAWLLYQCAEAIDMHYCISGCASLGWPSDVPDVFRRWGYSNTISFDERGFTDYKTWAKMIIRELQAGRPVLYSGLSLPLDGHSFVCDGYDPNNDLFHFNWGWGGDHFYEWFTIDSLVVIVQTGDTDDYTHFERIVRYISPASMQDYCDFSFPLADYYNMYYLAHIDGYNSSTPPQSLIPVPFLLTPQTMTLLTSASPTSRSEFRTIPSTATAEYRAHEEIHLRDGFTVERGAEFTAQIVPCANCESNRGIEDEYIEETRNEQEESVPDMAAGRPSVTTEGLRAETVLYPNPTDGELTIGVDGEVQSIVIYNALGRPVGGWKLHAITPDHVTLDINPLATGTYLLLVTTATGSRTAKFIKQ